MTKSARVSRAIRRVSKYAMIIKWDFGIHPDSPTDIIFDIHRRKSPETRKTCHKFQAQQLQEYCCPIINVKRILRSKYSDEVRQRLGTKKEGILISEIEVLVRRCHGNDVRTRSSVTERFR